MTAPLSRRRALTSAATLGVGVPLLAACGDDSTPSATDTNTPAASTTAPTSATTTATAESGSTTAEATSGLVATSEVPVGGGFILNGEEIVVTQPSAGEFKAFTAICTHTGCLVGSVADGEIICPCHGSTYDAADGSVTAGPAPSPLAAVAVKVVGDQVVRG